MTNPHDKAIEAACERCWGDSWKELHPGTRHMLREVMAEAIAAYERELTARRTPARIVPAP